MKQLLLVGLIVAAACGGDAVTGVKVPVDSTKTPPPTQVIVVSMPKSLRTGSATVASAAIQTKTAANPDATTPVVTWASSNARIATVSSIGEVRVFTPGQVIITASANNITSGTALFDALLDSTPPREILQSLTWTLHDSTANVGDPQFQASPVMQDTVGNKIGYVGKYISWGSTNPRVVSVNDSGVVTIVGGGSACLTALINGMARCRMVFITGPASTTPAGAITVTGPSTSVALTDTTQSLQASFTDANGAAIALTPAAWGAHNETFIGVNAIGKINPKRAGTSTISVIMNNIAKQFGVSAK